jgi:hypothetical protein
MADGRHGKWMDGDGDGDGDRNPDSGHTFANYSIRIYV